MPDLLVTLSNVYGQAKRNMPEKWGTGSGGTEYDKERKVFWSDYG